MKFASDRPYTDPEKAERVLATVRCRPAHAISRPPPDCEVERRARSGGGLRNGSQRRSSYRALAWTAASRYQIRTDSV